MWRGGMTVVHQQPLHGTLTELRTIPCSAANEGGVLGADLLGALSDSGKLSIIRFDQSLRRFVPIRQLHLGPPGVSVSNDFSQGCGKDQGGRGGRGEHVTTVPLGHAAYYASGGDGPGGVGGRVSREAGGRRLSPRVGGMDGGDVDGAAHQVFTKLAVDPRARCLAVACPTHVSVFFFTPVVNKAKEEDGSEVGIGGGWSSSSSRLGRVGVAAVSPPQYQRQYHDLSLIHI